MSPKPAQGLRGSVWSGSKQNAHILTGCNQTVLDLLAPESSPARSFKTVIVGSLSKTALHQVSAPLAIGDCSRRGRLLPRGIDFYLFIQPLDAPPRFGG